MLGVSHWSRFSRCGKPFLRITRRADARSQLSSHILTVYRPLVSNKELVAKNLREESKEFEILERSCYLVARLSPQAVQAFPDAIHCTSVADHVAT
jgi:hypothetical protein